MPPTALAVDCALDDVALTAFSVKLPLVPVLVTFRATLAVVVSVPIDSAIAAPMAALPPAAAPRKKVTPRCA